jgi:hypothetical protein
MEKTEEAPILPVPDLVQLREIAGLSKEGGNEEVDLLQEIMEKVMASASGREEQVQNDLLGALSLLKEEVVKPALKNHLLVRGMIALLRQHVTEEWQESLSRLEQLIKHR